MNENELIELTAYIYNNTGLCRKEVIYFSTNGNVQQVIRGLVLTLVNLSPDEYIKDIDMRITEFEIEEG